MTEIKRKYTNSEILNIFKVHGLLLKKQEEAVNTSKELGWALFEEWLNMEIQSAKDSAKTVLAKDLYSLKEAIFHMEKSMSPASFVSRVLERKTFKIESVLGVRYKGISEDVEFVLCSLINE